MLEINSTDGNLIEAMIIGTVGSEDIKNLQIIADKKIKEYGSIRILANSSGFVGWEDIGSMQKHIKFVQERHTKVDKVAVIIGHICQQWFASAASMFVKPEVKIFQSDEAEAAKKWVNS